MTKTPRALTPASREAPATRQAPASRQASADSGAADSGNVAEFSVSDLSTAIKRTIEGGFGHIRIRGEVSGFRGPHSSGHCYFALKDEKAKIDAIVWRGVFNRLRFKPEEGMEVIATGKVTTYPGASKYQIVIEALEPAGAGALMALLEERKKKLAAEGLFNEDRKRALPFLPRVVGIITSPTGAVIRDMLHGFNERFPAHVLIWPARVQGETSAGEVAAAVRGFNALAPGTGTVTGAIPRPDVIIVARGGGSLEDLWGFNEEIVVRAVAESDIPVIAAVGHETDWTLIDLVADARAPTPTKAAEWAVPKYSELLETNAKLSERLHIGIRRTLENARTHLRAAARGVPRLHDLLAMPRQRFDGVEKRLGRALLANSRAHAMTLTRVSARLRPQVLVERLGRAVERLGVADQRAKRAFCGRTLEMRRMVDSHGKLLGSLGYHSVLRRGYAVVRDGEGRALRACAGIAAGARLDIELSDGHIAAQALDTGKAGKPAGAGGGGRANSEVEAGAAPRAKPPRGIRVPKDRKAKNDGQGSLF